MLDLSAVNFVDSPGAATLADIRRLTDGTGVALRLTNAKPQVLRVLRADAP